MSNNGNDNQRSDFEKKAIDYASTGMGFFSTLFVKTPTNEAEATSFWLTQVDAYYNNLDVPHAQRTSAPKVLENI